MTEISTMWLDRPDIVIGAVDTYTFDQIKPWVSSLKQSGFAGDIYLICYRIDATTLARLECEYGVNVYHVDHDATMRPIQHAAKGSPTQAHNLRFFHAWELLTRLDANEYRFCIMTDVRDVIFQTNPSTWLENSGLRQNRFIAPSEGLMYANEEWGMANMIGGHGEAVWEMLMHDKTIYNVGTIAGDAEFMRRLFYMIYSMTRIDFYPADQSAFNILCHDLLKDHCVPTPMSKGWAAQIGTTWDHSKSWLWPRLNEPRPIVEVDGTVLTVDGVPFCMVHQYDRNPSLKYAIGQRYVTI